MLNAEYVFEDTMNSNPQASPKQNCVLLSSAMKTLEDSIVFDGKFSSFYKENNSKVINTSSISSDFNDGIFRRNKSMSNTKVFKRPRFRYRDIARK